MKNIFFILSLLLLFGCKQTEKPEQKIIFLSLVFKVLPDTLGNLQLYINQYIEYNTKNDSLIIAKSNGSFSYDEPLKYNEIPRFGLNEFYSYKYDKFIETKLDNLFSQKLEDRYYRDLGEDTIDDRYPQFIIIENGDNLQMLLFEEDSLPKDILDIIENVNRIANSDRLTLSQKNISEDIILKCQENMFEKNPPPRPLKPIEFIPPKIP